ncbi:MAG TPA: hypothetical protein VFX38_01485 [Gammaproteobacteria bacterium]|nr:hypothetical protein [Gammaproteobacteria bacterium]
MTDEIPNETLRAALAALPRELAPERDLWPDIEARIAPRRHFAKPWLAAAALAVVLVTGSIAAAIFGPRTPAPTQSVAANPLRAPSGFDAAQQRLRATTIAASIRESTQLDPKTQTVLLDNLGLIETSLANIQQALARNPGNASLQSLLYQLYRDEAALVAAAQRVQLQTTTGVAL